MASLHIVFRMIKCLQVAYRGLQIAVVGVNECRVGAPIQVYSAKRETGTITLHANCQ